MVYHKGELSKGEMDRLWPHQVALPAYRCIGHRYSTIQFFCEGKRLSLCTRRHSYRENDLDMTVFCFAERAHAEQFRERFGGELLDPRERPKRPGLRTRDTEAALDDRQRNGRCVNCAD